MAIPQSDGSIILPIEIDTKGLDKGIKAIKSRAKTLDDAFENIERTITSALNEGDTKTANLANNFKKATEEVQKQMAKVEELRSKFAELESKQLSGDQIKGLKAELDGTNAKIANLNQAILKLEAAKRKLDGDGLDTSAISRKLRELFSAVSPLNAKADELQARLKAALDVSTEVGTTRTELEAAENKLDNLSVKAEIAGQKMTAAMDKSGNAAGGLKEKISSVGDGFSKMGSKLLGMAKRVFVFAAITSALCSVRTEISDVLMSNTQFTASLNQLKASLWTAFAPIYNAIVPALITLVNWLNSAVTAITKFFAAITGKSYSAMVANGKALQQQAANYKKVGSASGSAAKGMKQATKEAEKQLAAFDDLQILQDNSKDSSGSGGTGTGGTGVANSDDMGSFVPDVEPWKAAIAGLAEVLVGVGLVALGIILCTMGQIGWGIGCIVFGLGAMGVGIATLSEAFDASGAKDMILLITGITGFILLSLGIILLYLGNIPWGIGALIGGIGLLGYTAYQAATKLNTDELISFLSTFLAFLGGALLAIGVILCWFGSIPIGIACIIVGVASLVGSGVVASKSDSNEIKDWLNLIMIAAGGALLALGIIITIFGGFSPLGIGLIVAGAAVLAVALINRNDTIPDEVKKWVNIIFAIVSAVALVIGIIMLCCGVVSPLSIGLVVAGAIGLASEVALNWDAIKDKISEIINNIKEWIEIYGMLVLGIILCLTGVGIALGIKLIVDWCKDNYGEVEVATAIVDKVKEIWDKVKTFWNENIKQIFTKDWWEKLAKKCGNGLIGGFEKAVNGVIGLFEKMINFVVKGLNKISFDIPEWVPGVGGKSFGFDLSEVDLGRVSIPRLAQGAVIPANREFLAVLGDQKRGTNIEAPAELIKQMAKEAYQEMGLANNQQQQIIKEEHYNLNQTELMTIIYKLVKGGERLNGTSLVKQGGI